MESVDRILAQLELDNKPLILVFNKMDRVDAEWVRRKLHRHGGVAVSALASATLEPLILAMQDQVEGLLTATDSNASADPAGDDRQELSPISEEESGAGTDL
jgi:GTP-binding protein HflX